MGGYRQKEVEQAHGIPGMAPQSGGLAAIMFGGGVSPTSTVAPTTAPRERLGLATTTEPRTR